MVKEGYVNSVNGEKVEVQAKTICLHGDSEKSSAICGENIQNIRT